MRVKLTNTLWIGDSESWMNNKTKSLLNVAQDLVCCYGWPDVEYMQVGLMDGPGNTTAAYHSAVLALVELQKRGSTLVMCHTGGRSLAVSLMYLNLTMERSWDECLDILRERIEVNYLPVPHKEHKAAFDKLNWKFLRKVAGE